MVQKIENGKFAGRFLLAHKDNKLNKWIADDPIGNCFAVGHTIEELSTNTKVRTYANRSNASRRLKKLQTKKQK